MDATSLVLPLLSLACSLAVWPLHRAAASAGQQGDPFTTARQQMVDRQIEGRGVRDAAVLAALRAVPRHRFVLPGTEDEAYEDRPVPIGYGQTISQPYIVDVTTGWYDAGIVKGREGEKNKLVPAISFRLKNTTSDTAISGVQINAVYRLVNEKDKEWGTTWVYGITSEAPLTPGATTQPLVLRGDRAYLGLEPRLQMLQNSHFADATVDLMAKYDAQQWTKLGTFPITRQLLTR
jgi:hypothetical protein